MTETTAQTPVRLYFESGAHHDMDHTTKYPIVGLDPQGRVIVDLTSEMGTKDGKPYLFGLTLCCDGFDKGYEDGVFCRSCGGANQPFDIGSNWPEVTDPFDSSTPWTPVPGHINDVDRHFCSPRARWLSAAAARAAATTPTTTATTAIPSATTTSS